MTSSAIDAEIARLTALRERIRASISDMEEDNVSGASFTDESINHLPLSELKMSEQEYNIRIGELLMRKRGLSLIFGQTVKTVQDNLI